MNRGEAQTLGHGLYRVYWYSGGVTLAAVGSNAQGQRWLAPTNWVRLDHDTQFNTEAWGLIERVELVERRLTPASAKRWQPPQPRARCAWCRFWRWLFCIE